MKSKCLTFLALSGLASWAHASLITAEFGVNLTEVYQYRTHTFEPIPALSGMGSFDVNSEAPLTVTHEGNTTRTAIVSEQGEYRQDVRFFSPLPQNFPVTSSGSEFLFQGPFNGYTFEAFTSDEASGFVEGVRLSAFLTGPQYDHGVSSPSYEFALTITRQTAARNGDGSSAYAFTSDRLLSFLQGAQQGGAVVDYVEGYSEPYSIEDFPYPVGVQGQRYHDANARIVGVKVDGVTQAIPEPSTWALTVVGIAALALAARRRRSEVARAGIA